ncbi:medium-chain acyl-CoA ligase ACSF2, mitochondrial isoform X1 [Neodiprion pinetum]|uniref:medium-chain acyl-CoA ligase ACSF2, mitochondrial isoform X1 n=1 Tax=Neodiprion pinetum TaxID=441929 RepID=UPI001EDFEF11|nr:medium-chain acyl-CoA ligase ACSF2, mitochondrial isoform X1 [Neodiprion pinetum]
MIRLRASIPKAFGNTRFDSRSGFISAVSFADAWKKSPSRRCRSTSASGENGTSYISNPGSYPLLEKTVGQLLDVAAERFPNRESVVSVHQNMRMTFSEARKRADKFAAGLKKLGLKRGDRVGIWSPNSIEWSVAFLAIARAGFKVVGMNPADQLNELIYGINKVGTRAVVAADSFKTQNYPEMLLRAKSQCPSLEHIVIVGDKHVSGTRRFVDVESLASSIEVEAIGAEQGEISPGSGMVIQFTSGTTGRPKAPEVAHRSYVNNSRQAVERFRLNDRHHKICLNVPYFHAFALNMGQVTSLQCGATVILAGQSFNSKESVNAIAREKCTVIYGTPTMWVDLVSTQQELKAPIGEISIGLTGGSPASPDLFRRARETFGFDFMKSIYGLSETTCMNFQTLLNTPREIAETTVGYLSDHTEVQVVDENGVPVPFGTPGELWTRGYHTMIGYWGDEENTRKTKTDDGWLKTGDQFVLRPDGYGRIIGRLKDMLIRGGENIFPKEIEEFLETHPAVLEAHVFGVHDDRLGEDVCACVRMKPGVVGLTPQDIKEYGRGRIAHFKIPRYVHLTEEFPKTTSGKIKKHVLRETLEADGIVPKKPDVS